MPSANHQSRSRSRSKNATQTCQVSAREQQTKGSVKPFLCLILGGPGSGKTSLGAGLQNLIPKLCHVSGGSLARLATTDEARQQSPLLNSIGRQLNDARRRKMATGRLANFVTDVLAEGLRSTPDFVGMIVDGVRVADLESFEKAHDSMVACILRIDCSRDIMLARLKGREDREGDGRLGLSAGADPCVAFQTTDRVDAFLKRAATEEDALRAFLGDRFCKTVCSIDGERSLEECLRVAVSAVRKAMVDSGVTLDSDASSAAATPGAVDWRAVIGSVAARWDTLYHPDGRLRVQDQAMTQRS